MKSKIVFLVVVVLGAFHSWAQTPQNVKQLDNESKDSLWTSTSAIVFVAILILLLIIGRNWSKKIQKKRDDLSNDEK